MLHIYIYLCYIHIMNFEDVTKCFCSRMILSSGTQPLSVGVDWQFRCAEHWTPAVPSVDKTKLDLIRFCDWNSSKSQPAKPPEQRHCPKNWRKCEDFLFQVENKNVTLLIPNTKKCNTCICIYVHTHTETKDNISMIHVSLERHDSVNKDLNQFDFCNKPPLKVSDFVHQMCMSNLESGKYGMSCMEDTSNYGTYSLRISSSHPHHQPSTSTTMITTITIQ